jgi:hypothetical protein
MSKIVFLDIDGVLNSSDFFKRRPLKLDSEFKSWFERDVSFSPLYHLTLIDPEAVQLLNKITCATGAKIVVSSTWRLLTPFDTLVDILREVGVTGEIIGKTPRLGGHRGPEVQEAIDFCSFNVDKFVILDDDADMDHLLPFLVQTSWEKGLEEHHVEKAIEMLKGN